LEVEEDQSYTLNGVAVHNCSHALEHLTYQEGLTFLRECRRVIKKDGAVRLIVPNARWLNNMYSSGLGELSEFDEINDGCAQSPTAAAKLWSLLHAGHQAAYDAETLIGMLKEAGFEGRQAEFRKAAFDHPGCHQILRETLDCLPSLSLYVDAVPMVA
jgi:hypothetical protein